MTVTLRYPNIIITEIPPSCEGYRLKGETKCDSKFEIDPDGLGGIDSFLVSLIYLHFMPMIKVINFSFISWIS